MPPKISYDLPLHRLNLHNNLLVYWEGDRKWYPGEITAVRGDHHCEVLYKDGEREWIDLHQVKYTVKRDPIRKKRKRAKKNSGSGSGSSDKSEIEEIENILFDVEDRIPLKGVCMENPEWWNVWHDDVMAAASRNDVRGMMSVTLSLAQQLKPAITTRWWAKHSDDWKKRVTCALTTWEATQVVKDLRDNAIRWSIARKLFSEDTGNAPKVNGSGDESDGLNIVYDPKPDESPSAGRCSNIEILISAPQKCSNLSESPMFPSMLDESPGLHSTVRVNTDSVACELQEKDSEEKMVLVACRRSNRFKKKSLFEELSLKNSICKPEFVVNQTKDADRVSIENCGSLKQANRSQLKNKKESGASIMAEDFDEDIDHKDDPSDETASGNSAALPNGLPCSICQTGVASNFLVQCKESGCFSTFHTFCLDPPLQIIEKDWLCPYCNGGSYAGKMSKDRRVVAKKIQKIVGCKRANLEDPKGATQEQFLIKWESFSHHHDSWVPREWLYILDRVRLNSYLRKHLIMNGSDLIDERKPEWFKIDRVIACRKKFNLDRSCETWDMCLANQDNSEFEFLVKWTGLDYSDSTWESSCTEELLAEVGKLVQRHQRATGRSENNCASSVIEPPKKNNLNDHILFDYQIQGLNWILSNFKAKSNVILADEMGLGKTVQVVSFVKCMREEKLNANPALIIAPKSILFQWEKEFSHWARDLNVIIYQGEKKSRHCIRKYEMYSSGQSVLFDALITNYELVILDKSFLTKFKWSAIIIDEAHKIKRLDCKLASYLKQYSSDFRLLLTGTPLQNTLLELFALLHFIDPEEFSDPIAEAKSFSCIKSGPRHSETEMKIAQIHALLKPRMLRRMKSDVLPESIPVKKWIEVPCALTDCQRELYINILEKNYEKLNREIQSGRKIILNFILMELRKCCNHPYLFPGQERHLSTKEAIFESLIAASGKLQLLVKLLPKLKERGNRVLLFSQMTKMLDILEDFLTFLGLSYFRIDGSTPMAARQQQMKDFNSPESQVFIFLMSTRAGGIGVDLPTADRVIIYDPDFNPFMDLQAQSRAHRIGQTRAVVVYQLITKCSTEVKILQKSKQKLEMENLVMNSSKKPSVDELHSVLLHGADKILNRKKLKDTSIHYDDNAIETLLKLDPTPGENSSPDENGYLGSIQSFNPNDDENEVPPASPKAEEWENVLGPVQADARDGNLGRGKRQKKQVNYDCDGGSDSDEIYSPQGSSSDDSSDSSDESEEEPEVGVTAGDEL